VSPNDRGALLQSLLRTVAGIRTREHDHDLFVVDRLTRALQLGLKDVPLRENDDRCARMARLLNEVLDETRAWNSAIADLRTVLRGLAIMARENGETVSWLCDLCDGLHRTEECPLEHA